ncbi:hypothetical protein [Paracoccus siganidrum]|uniref:hypothetical protein n=1 Tax=Paracoccus siganidrum TaxID=1276757 RepID=UPI0011C35B75|nr:hypothetical protein [Paracoccus siganidrum]
MREGDLLRIPIDDFFVAAKVIWISNRYKDVCGIVVYPACFQCAENVRAIDGDYLVMKMGQDNVRVLYPSVKNVTKKKIWEVVGSAGVMGNDEIPYHIIGGLLCKGDDEVRNATSEDYARFPRMMTAGPIVVQNLIRQALSNFQKFD